MDISEDAGMVISRQSCPLHADEDILGERVDQAGTLKFVCERSGHPGGGLLTWITVPEPPDVPGLTGLAEELGLGTELPALLNEHTGKWVEYGVVEAAYADAHPDEFAMLVARYGHTAVAPMTYTVSSFLSGTLGRLSKRGDVLLSWRGPTGRWKYNSGISWWALPPAPPADAEVSWESLGRSMDYVPGAVKRS